MIVCFLCLFFVILPWNNVVLQLKRNDYENPTETQ